MRPLLELASPYTAIAVLIKASTIDTVKTCLDGLVNTATPVNTLEIGRMEKATNIATVHIPTNRVNPYRIDNANHHAAVRRAILDVTDKTLEVGSSKAK